MKFSNKNNSIIYLRCIFLLPAIVATGCAFAPWEASPDKAKVTDKQVAEAKQNLAKAPEVVIKRKDLLITSELATSKYLIEAEQAQAKGNYAEAIILYDKVLSFLPDNPNAINGKIKVERELEQAKKIKSAEELIQSNKLEDAKEQIRNVLLENPNNAEAIRLQNQLKDKLPPQSNRPPQLKVRIERPISLELRDANIKVVFEALSRATGINFILDKDIKPETKASIFIKKARIEDAIDMVLSSNGLQKKVLSENTVLVFSNTQQKLKDYQDLMIRSFYFTNTTAKQVAALIKSMLKTKDVFVDDRLNMLVMRDTPEVIRIAEKLIAANDLEDPEVMLDIEVLEVSRNRLQELGIVYPNQLAVLGGTTGLTLEALKAVNSSTIGVSPNPAINFRKTTGDVNLLSNPRIRVKNNEKAKILVGDKVPIITTTSTANVGISENVQYIDVGLKLDVEPRITLNNFVNIKIGLEVSSLGARTVTKNGAEVFTIGTRNANTVLSLKNGETQVLAGLISDDERKSSSRVPGLGDIPLLGRLFSNQEDKKLKTEIVLAITPRIISNINRPTAEVSEYWSGTEAVISDKPQLSLPAASSPPLSAIERARENMRLRQQQAQELQAEQPAPEPVSEPTSEPVPAEQAPERAAGQPLEPVPIPPAVDPANPPPGL